VRSEAIGAEPEDESSRCPRPKIECVRPRPSSVWHNDYVGRRANQFSQHACRRPWQIYGHDEKRQLPPSTTADALASLSQRFVQAGSGVVARRDATRARDSGDLIISGDDMTSRRRDQSQRDVERTTEKTSEALPQTDELYGSSRLL